TSSGHRDAWCAAVTGRREVVVWFGRAAGGGAGALVGAEAAAPVALRLAAALDRQPTPWRALDMPARPQSQPAVAAPQPAVLSPQPGLQIEMNPELPAERQKVALRAIAGESRLWWLIDGEPVGVARSGETIWWSPAVGEHELRVIDERGNAARMVVVVR